MSDDLFELGRDILARQPFSTLLGTELETFEPGRAVLRLAIRDELKQQHGYVHGGVISYLAVCHCEVTAIDGENERMVAIAQGTIIRVNNPAG